MRVLKSLMALWLCLAMTFVQAQDTTIVEDTVFVTGNRDTTAFFHADKPVGGVQWNERVVPDSTLQRLHSDDAFWYANTNFKKKTEHETAQPSFLQWLFDQKWFYNLVWAVIICSCIAVMLLFLTKSNISLFRKAPRLIADANNPELSENIFTIEYKEALEKAVAQKNFHAAVRLHFLQVLAQLADKNLIQYKEGLTNSDYLQQLSETSYYADYKKLTHHFEYAWYGRFPINPELYNRIETDFTSFKKRMGI